MAQSDLLKPLTLNRQATAKSDSKDWAEAEKLWMQATELNPTDPNAWLELGRSRYSQKKYLEAIAPVKKADELGVSYPWDMPYFEACCWALGGKTKEALEALRKAIDLGFRDLPLARTDEDLMSLHSIKEFHELVGDEDVSKLDRNAGIIHDIRFYLREVKRLSYRSRQMGGTSVERFAEKLIQDVPKLTENQVLVRMMEMAAQVSDGHTHLRPVQPLKDGIPIWLGSFAEGLFVTAATPDQKDLLGAKLLSISGRPTEKLLQECSHLFGQDNTQWIYAQGPGYMRHLRCLNGLGLCPSDQTVEVKLELDGKVITRTLKGESGNLDAAWVKLKDQVKETPAIAYQKNGDWNWFKYLPDSKTVFFQYNTVSNSKEKSVKQLAEEMFAFIDANPVERLIIDTRWNGGGNNFLNEPILLGLVKSKVNVRGKLFVIIGKATFSAAQCFVTQVERFTNAVFAGEPSGSSPNFIGESIPVTLPCTKLGGTISDLYWQNSVAMDHRKWISPAIYMPPTFAAYSKLQDPVVDAIMEYKLPDGK